MKPDTKEADFINEYTKFLLATVWAPMSVGSEIGIWVDPKYANYLAHAQQKGWVNKQGTHVLAAGYGVAAAYHRR